MNIDPDGRLVWFGVPLAYWLAGGAALTAGGACVATNCGQVAVDAAAAVVEEVGDAFCPPDAANDSEYDGGDEPPDCNEQRRLLNQMFHAIETMAKSTNGNPDRIAKVALERRRFQALVQAYERQCGPYNEPPSFDDLYSR